VPEPRRPDPEPLRRSTQIQQRLQTIVRQIRDRTPSRRLPKETALQTTVEAANHRLGESAPPASLSGLWMALIAVGSAALALGGLWSWQSWSDRSAPPIDELLPPLSDLAEPLTEPAAGEDEQTRPPARTLAAQATVSPEQSGETETPSELLVVHVSGAVGDPGVVMVSPGARVYEAIEAAGSAAASADLERINLAAPVGDGERIHVPAEGEADPPSLLFPERPNAAVDLPAASGELMPVDINQATARDLESLPGVGPATAAAIVQTREARGPFLSVQELLEVPGIGDAKLQQLLPFATAEP